VKNSKTRLEGRGEENEEELKYFAKSQKYTANFGQGSAEPI